MNQSRLANRSIDHVRAGSRPLHLRLIWICLPILFATSARAADVDYLQDIKPVLKAKCYSCHGAIEQEAGLRLDTVSLMQAGGDSGPALVAGDVPSSRLIARVTTLDQSERMPPEGEPLSREQIARFTAWIESGAKGPDNESPQGDPSLHWAFQPLQVVVPPGEATHPIDSFVRQRLTTAGLHWAPPADTVALIRRMFFDLHGLPPTPQQIAKWQTRIDHDRNEVSALIDELLSSPRYGERWAQHWLDIVRYADTHGYEVNTPRANAWPYRDYVIAAFNDDKPYDQFVQEQLAGDALGDDVATGFMVAAAALLPGQIGKDEESKRLARQDELDEIIVGTSATFLALTVGCARCHDHKFDPIPQDDYYAMQAFFAGVEYGEREIRDRDQQARIAKADAMQAEIDLLRGQLNQYHPKAFTGRTIIIDDEDLDRVTLLKTKNGHGANPDGTQPGYLQDVGDADRCGNLSRGRYTWWNNEANEDVFTWNPTTEGRFRLWISWGVHGSGVHTRDARYVLDLDGDLSTTTDQSEIARADQYYFANVSEGESEKKPLWSGLADAGVHDFRESTRLVLRGGETETGITADVIVLQEETEGSLPQLRAPVHAAKTVERFEPIEAKFVRFTSLQTIDDNKHQPCIDELEVFTAGDAARNIALAKHGTKPTSSGNYSDTGKHQLKHINDGRYGNSHSWISDEYGKGWVQLEFPAVEQIDRIEWARDREAKFSDRLPVRYRIESSIDGLDWTVVASSADRVPPGTPHDEIQALLRNGSTVEIGKLPAMAKELRELQKGQADLRKGRTVFAGTFRAADPTYVLNRGDPEQPTKAIAPRVLTSIGSLSLPAETPEQQRRISLANWITADDNPLTARVMVNRIWQYHFGVGLVETASDFGLNGAPPTHPLLLDWLTGEFLRRGLSVKQLHRLIMTSQTYQQSSVWQSDESDPGQHPLALDADCQLLWRFPTRRLEAEAIRDCMLHVSGQLNLATGGPGFDFFKTRGGLSGFPAIEEFGANEQRRMIYSHKIRMERVPVFGAFDCPDAGLPTPRRSQSTTAIQALNLFNSPFVISQAEAFARRIEEESDGSIQHQILLAYKIAFGRSPYESERTAVEEVVRDHGLSTLCRVLFNSSEFLFIP